MKNLPVICKVENCGRKARSRSFCNMHYARFRRTGETGEASPRKALNGTYSIIVSGKRIWIAGRKILETSSEYVKLLRIEKRKVDPNWGKSIKSMHKLRFGGLREQVSKRDQFTCQLCGMTDKEHREVFNCEITVDHKDGYGRYSEEKHNTLDNLWVLCKSCHGRRDWYRWALSQGKEVSVELIDALELSS